MNFCFFETVTYITVYAVFVACICLTKSELCANWINRVSNDGEIFKVIKPCGYIQCIKECKRSADCAEVTFDRDQLNCGLVRKSTATSFPVDLSTRLGPCATKKCSVNERCVSMTDGSGLCINALTCEGIYTQGRCFFEGSTSTWFEGRDKCQELDGSLATIDSNTMNYFILRVTSAGVFWVGGNDLDTEGTWTWIANGQPVDLTSWWYQGQPQASSDDADCLGVQSSGVWRDVSCSLAAPFICQTYLTQ
ncbi:low affinity immunoglobulin epsilon Fc receptor-like [Ylistrum balloti]|uniref:low affinity immunoglobulin epsilon Fc receptor-like n=1 Tax=Ylistrum balloti TaxID=509963 RepID=UPI002905BF80|nr:low affinity immunoglobulin epsilon Fc receptor-like [Ylistrum balloti]